MRRAGGPTGITCITLNFQTADLAPAATQSIGRSKSRAQVKGFFVPLPLRVLCLLGIKGYRDWNSVPFAMDVHGFSKVCPQGRAAGTDPARALPL